jgi:hypothetical protein
LGNTNEATCILIATAIIVQRAPSIIAPSKSIHQLPILNSTKSTPRYIRQLANKPPKSNFKALLIVTSLLRKAKQMSLSQQISEGLKSHDVEPSNGSFRPPIPYVPERIVDLDPDQKVPIIKVKLSNGVESRQPMCSSATCIWTNKIDT